MFFSLKVDYVDLAAVVTFTDVVTFLVVLYFLLGKYS